MTTNAGDKINQAVGEMTLKDLTPNVAGLLCYVVGWISGIVFDTGQIALYASMLYSPSSFSASLLWPVQSRAASRWWVLPFRNYWHPGFLAAGSSSWLKPIRGDF